MENIDSSEKQNILEDLDSRSGIPNVQFKNSLRSRVISVYKEEPATGKFFFNEKTINFLSIFIVIISVGIVAGAGIISLNNGNQVVNVDSVSAVPAAKKPEILEGIIKNNPDALILQTATVISEDPSNIASVAETAQQVSVTSEVKGYNFSFTKATSEFGQNINCSDNSSVTKDIYNYSENGLNIYRVVNLNTQNSVVDSVQVETKNGVTTSKYSRDGVEQILFSSNNLEIENKPVSLPVSSPQVTSDNIENYFDGESQNITEVTRDGAKFYVLETQSNYDCNGNVINAVFKKWFNKDDFSIFKKEVYKTNSTEENLIERTTYKVANQQVNFIDIKNNFLPEDSEDTIDISQKDSLETLQEFLTSNLENIPADSSIGNLNISKFQDLSLMNSLFYKEEFNYMQSINSQPKPYLKYSLGDVNVEVYNKDIVNSSLFSNTVDGISQDIKVGDEFFTGDLFTNTLPVSFAKDTTPKQTLVLELNGLKYVFSSNNLDSIINNGLDSLSLSEIFNATKI